MDQGDFLTTVYSSDSKEYFPRNSSSDFTVQLPQHLQLPHGLYEVGLQSLSFFHFVDKKGNDPPISDLHRAKTFFNGERVFATVYKKAIGEVAVKKPEDENTGYLQVVIASTFQESSLGLAFTELVLPLGTKTIMHWTDKKGRTLVIPDDLCTVFGFLTKSFKPGRYESEGYRDPAFYNAIPADTPFKFLVVNTIEHEIVELKEPSEYSLESLIHMIADSFVSAKFQIGVLLNKSKNGITVRINQDKTSFKFSKVVCDLFGIDEDFEFSEKKTQFLVSENLRNLEADKDEDIPVPVEWKDYPQLFVHTDLIDCQIIGSCLQPVIRSFPLDEKGINKRVLYQDTPVLYAQTAREDVSTIRVQIKNQRGVPFQESPNPTCAVFHFRRRRI